jgi:hypothetical protein
MFDASRYLSEHFGGPDGVLALLAKHTDTALPERSAVEKWFQRGSIPSGWLPLLHIAAEAEKSAPVSFAQYVSVGGAHDIFT